MAVTSALAQAFATLTPNNIASERVLCSRGNRFLLHRIANRRPPASQGVSGRSIILARLSLSLLTARRHVRIGSSRANDIQLPRADATIDAHHLVLKLDFSNGSLLLTDVSRNGTMIQTEGVWMRLHCASVRLRGDTIIQLGSAQDQLQFTLQPEIASADRRALLALRAEHAVSTGHLLRRQSRIRSRAARGSCTHAREVSQVPHYPSPIASLPSSSPSQGFNNSSSSSSSSCPQSGG